MRKTFRRVLATAALAGASTLVLAAPALAAQPSTAAADDGGVVIVDEPDTSGLNNTWTFAPAGVPVFGAIQSVAQVPGKLF